MSIPKCKHFFKKLDKFSVCAMKADPKWIGVEQEPDSFGVYMYVVHGRARIGVPFEKEYFEVKSKDFFSMQHLLHEPIMMETYDDLYIIAFNSINKNKPFTGSGTTGEVWDGKLVTEPTLHVSKESHLICFDGNPIVNGKQLERFDYADISPDRTYEINLNDGALGLFTEVSFTDEEFYDKLFPDS